jgi:hypothetical protein
MKEFNCAENMVKKRRKKIMICRSDKNKETGEKRNEIR